MTTAEKRHLLYVAVLALVVRVFVCVVTPVIGTDCYNFFNAARYLVEGQNLEALRKTPY
ncbi:MAG: hypothetical protein ACE5KK_04100 [Candidatus Brocadiales bacterium]